MKRQTVLSLSLVAAAALSTSAAAQSLSGWNVSAGFIHLPSTGYGGRHLGAVDGGVVEVGAQVHEWTSGALTIGMHGAVFGSPEKLVICSGLGVCGGGLLQSVARFASVGAGFESASLTGEAWQLKVRPFAELAFGSVARSGRVGPNRSFTAPLFGLAVTGSHRKVRLSIEAGGMTNVLDDYPKVIAIQLGFTP